MTGSTRIDAAIVPASSLDVSSRGFVPGQRVIGRVLDALSSNQFLLAVGSDRLVAQSVLPLTPGQEIALEVLKTGATLEMRLLSGDAVSAASETGAEHARALAALVNAARAGRTEGATRDEGALRSAVDALMKSGQLTGAGDVEALARALTPTGTEGDPASLAARLRAAYDNGGHRFEARLRSVFEAHPELADQQALERVRDDARALIGRAAGALAKLADPDAAAATRTQLDTVAAHLLARQVQSGLHWIAEGTLTFKLPVRLPSGEADAEVIFRREPEGESDVDERSPGFNVRFRVTSGVVGPVDASVSWRGPALNTTLSVANAEARDVLQPELAGLERGLRETFAHVQASLVVDPARVHAGSVNETVPDLPGGSLLSVRA